MVRYAWFDKRGRVYGRMFVTVDKAIRWRREEKARLIEWREHRKTMGLPVVRIMQQLYFLNSLELRRGRTIWTVWWKPE